MTKRQKQLWGMYGALLAVFIILTLVIPSERTPVFFTAFIGTAALFVIAAVSAALKFRQQDKLNMKTAWPDAFTMLVIQLIIYAFLDMGSVFCPYYIAVVAELVVYVPMVVIIFGEERLREAVRWLYRHRKSAAVCVLAAIVAIPVVYFGTPFVKYKWAESQLVKGEFASAAETFLSLGDYMEAPEQAKESLYGLGMQLNGAGEYEQAYFTLQDIAAYEDVQAYIDANPELAAVREKYGAYSVGGAVTMGEWQGAPLEWGVLAQEGSRRLLFAMKPLCQKAFNDEFDITYWETSTLRAWLNDEFLPEAFADDERARILETYVKNDDNVMYRTEGGEDTVDRIYLLSIDEAEQYRKEYREWFMSSTHAMWLRSPGCSRIDAATVSLGGGIDEMGTNIDWTNVSVRPVMWIDLLAE